MSNKERSMGQAIISCKCPQCREGAIFTHGPLAIKYLGQVHKHCPNCDFKYEMEPGFFWAAMYISYGINVALMVAIWVSIRIFLNPDGVLYYVLPIVGTMLLFFPFLLPVKHLL